MLTGILARRAVTGVWRGKDIQGYWSVVHPDRYLVNYDGHCPVMFDHDTGRWFIRRKLWSDMEVFPDAIAMSDEDFFNSYRLGLAEVIRRKLGVKKAAKGEGEVR